MSRLLFTPADVSDIEELAIGVGRFGKNLHAGIIYRIEGPSWRSIDFMTDGSLRMCNQKNIDTRFCWAIPNFEPEILRLIANFCEVLLENQQRGELPSLIYAAKYAPSSFSFNGNNVSYGTGAKGLTCSTFIMTVFHTFNCDLLEYNTWEFRERDLDWQVNFEEMLSDPDWGFGPESQQVNREDLPCLRYSPTDLLAACVENQPPIDFNTAESRFDDLKSWIDMWMETSKRRKRSR